MPSSAPESIYDWIELVADRATYTLAENARRLPGRWKLLTVAGSTAESQTVGAAFVDESQGLVVPFASVLIAHMA